MGKFRQFPNRLKDACSLFAGMIAAGPSFAVRNGAVPIQSSVRLYRQAGDLGSIPLEMFEDVGPPRCSVVQVMKCRPLD